MKGHDGLNNAQYTVTEETVEAKDMSAESEDECTKAESEGEMDVDESAEGAVPDLDRGHGTSILCDSCAGCSRVRIAFYVAQNQPDQHKFGKKNSK